MKCRIPNSGGGNMNAMLKQAQKMQEDMAAKQAELEEQEAELSKKRAMDEVKQEMVAIASMMAAKVVAANIDTTIQGTLVEETLKEMGESTWQS